VENNDEPKYSHIRTNGEKGEIIGTLCAIKTEDNKIVYGASICSESETGCDKSKGKKIALGRATAYIEERLKNQHWHIGKYMKIRTTAFAVNGVNKAGKLPLEIYQSMVRGLRESILNHPGL